MLDEAFYQFIKENSPNTVYDDMIQIFDVPNYPSGGELICLSWWKETALPLLKKRYCELLKV